MLLLKEFIKHPKEIGSISPSSPFLSERVLKTAGLRRSSNVLELGPGGGALTENIIRMLGPRGTYLGLEINPRMVERLQKRFPELDVQEGCAATYDLSDHIDHHGAFDVVISGLPWASFEPEFQRRILQNAYAGLRDNGTFVSFAYLGFHLLPGGRAFQNLLDDTFVQVRKTNPVIRNLPPAFVYVCQK